jgi:hypothetical protein
MICLIGNVNLSIDIDTYIMALVDASSQLGQSVGVYISGA